MTKYPSQMQDKFNLRFPDGMRDAIAERAKANGRSMNSEIIQILQDALDYSPEQATSDAIDKAYFDEIAGMDEETLQKWFEAISENTRVLNESTELIKNLKKRTT